MVGIMPGMADQTAVEGAKTSVGMTSASDKPKAGGVIIHDIIKDE